MGAAIVASGNAAAWGTNSAPIGLIVLCREAAALESDLGEIELAEGDTELVRTARVIVIDRREQK